MPPWFYWFLLEVWSKWSANEICRRLISFRSVWSYRWDLSINCLSSHVSSKLEVVLCPKFKTVALTSFILLVDKPLDHNSSWLLSTFSCRIVIRIRECSSYVFASLHDLYSLENRNNFAIRWRRKDYWKVNGCIFNHRKVSRRRNTTSWFNKEHSHRILQESKWRRKKVIHFFMKKQTSSFIPIYKFSEG